MTKNDKIEELLKYYAKNNYYSRLKKDGEEEDCLCEAYEYFTEEDINEMIDNDVLALKRLIDQVKQLESEE